MKIKIGRTTIEKIAYGDPDLPYIWRISSGFVSNRGYQLGPLLINENHMLLLLAKRGTLEYKIRKFIDRNFYGARC